MGSAAGTFQSRQSLISPASSFKNRVSLFNQHAPNVAPVRVCSPYENDSNARQPGRAASIGNAASLSPGRKSTPSDTVSGGVGKAAGKSKPNSNVFSTAKPAAKQEKKCALAKYYSTASRLDKSKAVMKGVTTLSTTARSSKPIDLGLCKTFSGGAALSNHSQDRVFSPVDAYATLSNPISTRKTLENNDSQQDGRRTIKGHRQSETNTNANNNKPLSQATPANTSLYPIHKPTTSHTFVSAKGAISARNSYSSGNPQPHRGSIPGSTLAEEIKKGGNTKLLEKLKEITAGPEPAAEADLRKQLAEVKGKMMKVVAALMERDRVAREENRQLRDELARTRTLLAQNNITMN